MEITNPSCPRCGSLDFEGEAPRVKCTSCGQGFDLAKAVPMVIADHPSLMFPNPSEIVLCGDQADLYAVNQHKVELALLGPSASTHNSALMALLSRQIYLAEKEGMIKPGDLVPVENAKGDVVIIDNRKEREERLHAALMVEAEKRLKAKYIDEPPRLNRAERRRRERGRYR